MKRPSGWRPSNERSLGDALGDMVDAYGMREKLDELRLAALWDEATGPLIARHTLQLSLRKGHLRVRVDNAPLRQELQYMKDRLRALLNERMGTQVVLEVTVE